MKSQIQAFEMKSNPPILILKNHPATQDLIACDFIRALRGFHPPARVDLIEKALAEASAFFGDPDGNRAQLHCAWLGDPICKQIRYPPHRSSLKSSHSEVFLTLRPSRVRFPIIIAKKEVLLCRTSFLVPRTGIEPVLPP